MKPQKAKRLFRKLRAAVDNTQPTAPCHKLNQTLIERPIWDAFLKHLDHLYLDFRFTGRDQTRMILASELQRPVCVQEVQCN